MRDEVFVEEVLSKCEALRSAQLWAPEPRLNPRRWLQNFDPKDRATAAAILNRVIFLSNEAVDRAFALAFLRLQQSLARPGVERKTQIAEFLAHLDSALFCPTAGEDPSPADSGYIFTRATRDRLGIDERRLASTAEAKTLLTQDTTIYFVDDCIGSGNQLVKVWRENFSASHKQIGFHAAALCVVATQEGLDRVSQDTPIRVFPGHTLTERYSIKNLDSAAPLSGHPEIQTEIQDLLRRTSGRLSFNGKTFIEGAQKSWGFGEMGHSLIFEHSCPDWSLPVLWSEGSTDWHPLYRP